LLAQAKGKLTAPPVGRPKLGQDVKHGSRGSRKPTILRRPGRTKHVAPARSVGPPRCRGWLPKGRCPRIAGAHHFGVGVVETSNLVDAVAPFNGRGGVQTGAGLRLASPAPSAWAPVCPPTTRSCGPPSFGEKPFVGGPPVPTPSRIEKTLATSTAQRSAGLWSAQKPAEKPELNDQTMSFIRQKTLSA